MLQNQAFEDPSRRRVAAGAAMKRPKEEMIERLKLEIDFIQKGGYNPLVRFPREEPKVFRDSISCLNLGLKEKIEPCDECFLMEFVPSEAAHLDEPCHYIPLNSKSDTVASLESDSEKQKSALLTWLKSTVRKLEGQMSSERPAH